MNDLLFSLNTVFPLLGMMAVGYAARALKWVSQKSMREINSCVFRIFLPLSLFFNIIDTEAGVFIDLTALIYSFAATLIMFGILFLTMPRLIKERRCVGVMIQGSARSNYALFGIPLVMMMYPDRDYSIAVLMVATVVPVFNIISTIALTAYSDRKYTVRQALKSIVTNPLIITTVVGLLVWQSGIKIPSLLASPFRKLGGIASPVALFVLGASLDFGKAQANRKMIVSGVLLKLVIIPLVFLSAAVLIGVRDVSLAALIAVFASPTSISSFPMAQQMGGDGDLAGAQVVFSTAFSIVSVFIWILVFRMMGLLA